MAINVPGKCHAMSVNDWIVVKDNPIQRDTERHAQKAKHLLKPLPVHAIVWAAKLPGGGLIKLDGHTRAYLWSRNVVERPDHVEVHTIDVKTTEEAAELYKTFDSKEALETTPDKVSGALRGMNYQAQSGLISSGAFSEAIRYAWYAVYGYGREMRYRDIYEAIQEFAAEIIFLDELLLRRGQFPSGVLASIILTWRKHGDPVGKFWKAVMADAGVKASGRMDGVQALNELIISRHGKAGGASAMDMLGRALSCAEKWMADETLTGIPRPLDITTYLDQKARPKYKLLKKVAKPDKADNQPEKAVKTVAQATA